MRGVLTSTTTTTTTVVVVAATTTTTTTTSQHSLVPVLRGPRCVQIMRDVPTRVDSHVVSVRRPRCVRPWPTLGRTAYRCSVRRRPGCGRGVWPHEVSASTPGLPQRQAGVCTDRH